MHPHPITSLYKQFLYSNTNSWLLTLSRRLPTAVSSVLYSVAYSLASVGQLLLNTKQRAEKIESENMEEISKNQRPETVRNISNKANISAFISCVAFFIFSWFRVSVLHRIREALEVSRNITGVSVSGKKLFLEFFPHYFWPWAKILSR